MSDNLQNILQDLQQFNENNVVESYLPSTKSRVITKKLNIKQQKSLILVAADDILSLVNFRINLYNALKENVCFNDFSKLNMFDRNSIVFTWKAETESKYRKIVSNYEKTTIDLGKVLKGPIKDKNLTIKQSIPSLEKEYKFDLLLQERYKDGVKDRKEFVNTVFLIELAKFIDSITINDKTIDLSTLTISNVIKVMDSLPCLTEINEFITAVKDVEQSFNRVGDDVVDVTPNLFI